jgi:hypothetical protein
MATGRNRKPKEVLSEDEIVQKLVPEPGEKLGLKVLVGLLGRSPREGYWRLYVTAYLNDYFEFLGDDVCHHRRLQPDQSPLGGTIVWVKATADIARISSTPAMAAQEFLQGEIAKALFPSALASPVGGLRPWLFAVNTWVCTNRTAGTCTLVLCTRVEECKISREANPCV